MILRQNNGTYIVTSLHHRLCYERLGENTHLACIYLPAYRTHGDGAEVKVNIEYQGDIPQFFREVLLFNKEGEYLDKYNEDLNCYLTDNEVSEVEKDLLAIVEEEESMLDYMFNAHSPEDEDIDPDNLWCVVVEGWYNDGGRNHQVSACRSEEAAKIYLDKVLETLRENPSCVFYKCTNEVIVDNEDGNYHARYWVKEIGRCHFNLYAAAIKINTTIWGKESITRANPSCPHNLLLTMDKVEYE